MQSENILNEIRKEKSGIAKEEIPVMATIIIKIGLTIPALTAACPKTKAPTIPDSRSNSRRNTKTSFTN